MNRRSLSMGGFYLQAMLKDEHFFAFVAEHNFRHKRAASHACLSDFAIGASGLHDASESRESFRVPGFFYGHSFISAWCKLHSIVIVLIEAAGRHGHVGAYIAAEATAFACV